MVVKIRISHEHLLPRRLERQALEAVLYIQSSAPGNRHWDTSISFIDMRRPTKLPA